MSSGISEHELNAFVDGELPPATAARVASAIATDPGMARRVAYLHRMKAAVSGMADDLPLPDLPVAGVLGASPTPPARPARASLRRLVTALSGVAAMLIILLWSAPASGPIEPALDLPRMALHDQWSAREDADGRVALPDGFAWLEPVMRAGRLQLVHRVETAGVEHFGFRGPNACRISLFVAEGRGPDSPLRLTLAGRVQHAQWQVAGRAFEMIARDMAPTRFAAVAASLHRHSHDPVHDAALQVALVQAARLPCRA